MNHSPVIALMGPTASGKTGLALSLARHFPIEIISVDSALVYRDMDIGTAKPSREERSVCPHHLIDIISPLEAYSAAQFHQDTTRLVSEIRARGKIPVLVGGTMLYFKALQEGLSDLPKADPELRRQLDEDAAREGWPALHARLAGLDPATAARLEPGDAQRIQRALEVCLLSGRPMSELLEKGREGAMPFTALPLVLVPEDRRWLHRRIAERFGLMLEQGFLEEMIRLRTRYPQLTPDLPSMRCVGYRQAWAYQEGEIDRQTFIDQGVAATRQLAKRQLTWARGMDLVPLNAQSPDLEDTVLRAVAAWVKDETLPDDIRWTGEF
ncbi:tRNA (adenosine(37)-N6)-dimethylallyltransferase MiaA [Paludibacterium paludis]|uniref:tRNA dimethylallyltransferase n=1 Tax=Paludibacterium paludis TaxID=1225769 RepID=A0A918U8G8_9NEIS|nr:tRNA (adenosine(37)-N6)-dimethylallyltransferase MiaA [Paludibacterium paludis]GGY11469.1 tRNA dimethylallyltransferase [Paludibacterium paludis]